MPAVATVTVNAKGIQYEKVPLRELAGWYLRAVRSYRSYEYDIYEKWFIACSLQSTVVVQSTEVEEEGSLVRM